MLAQMIMNKKVIAFFFLGFLLSAYLGVPVVGIAAFGVLAAMIKVDFNNTSPVTVEDGGADDDF
jgi:fructoselysine and glucoselysine-specific PTS system IIC component